MSKIKRLISFPIFAFLLIAFASQVFAQVIVEPMGFAELVAEGENSEVELNIFNLTVDRFDYEIKTHFVDPEDERRGGPRRDDLGDVIRTIGVREGRWIGLAWDGELLWGSDQRDNWRMTPVNMDGDILNQVNVEFTGYYGSCWDGENFWLAHYNESRLARVDREGRLLNAIQVNAQPFGMTWDGETLWYARYQNQDIQQVTLEGEVLRTWNCEGIQGRRTMELAWVPDHPDGQLWITACDPGTIYQINVEPDPPEIVQTVNVQDSNVYGLDHDGENLWYTTDRGDWICIDDGVAEFNMLTFEPEEGEIQGQGAARIIANIFSEGVEAGVYEFLVEINIFSLENEDDEPVIIPMSVVISIDSPTADLLGTVSSSRDGEIIQNAMIKMDRYKIVRFTDGEGEYIFNALPTGAYVLTVSADDFLTQTFEFNIDGEGEVVQNFELPQAECVIAPEEIDVQLGLGEEFEQGIVVTNAGNGPLTYTTDRRLLGDANAEPWELRTSVPVGAITQDSRIQGAVFIEDNFYVAGADDGDCQIYVLNRDQEIINQYAQLGEANYGYKDLAWDGELIWGSGERVVYGFTPDGEEVTSFDTGIAICTNLAWDSEREILWVSGTTTDIFGFDREGNRVEVLNRLTLRIYGLAYWPDDPDGYQLYIFHKLPEVGNFLITKMDIDSGDTLSVVNLLPEAGGAAQACFITNQYDIYSWVFMGLANAGAQDRIDIWQLDARKNWMAIDPTEGVIEPGEEQEFVVTLDATGLPQALFEGEVVFLHDGVGSETHLPISLQVGEGGGGGPEEMVLELGNGWNMVSAYLQPDPDGIITIMADLVEAGTLVMVKNGSGQFYNPQFGFNNIPGWRVDEGYMIKMDGADQLVLIGEAVPWNQPIPLDAGWQMVSYYPRQGIDAILALSGIVDVLLMAKDGAGRFYSPPFGFSNMGNLILGQGYLLKMDEAAELVYTVEERLAAQAAPYAQPTLLPVHPVTNENMSLLVFTDISEGEIGVYSNGNLVGSGVMQDGMCGIAVWGDDPTTERLDGALINEKLELRLHLETGEEYVLNYESLSGNNTYETDALWAVQIEEIANPQNFGITSLAPNPFNAVSRLVFRINDESNVNLAIFDIDGRQVMEVANGHMQAGDHSISIDGSDLASGLYFIRLSAGTQVDSRKLTLIK